MSSSSAPGALELIRSFVNTVEAGGDLDLLAADGSLADWCASAGLPEAAPDELRLLREFREALRAVLETHAGEGDSQAAWGALTRFAAIPSFKMEIALPSKMLLQPEGDRVQGVIGRLLALVYEAIGAGTWRRLKACRKETCRWAFYDLSKNGSGAWCSMRVCGNRVKAQRRRRREQAALPGRRNETSADDYGS